MKKILFVTASMSRGGAERVISILSDCFVKAGFSVDIMVLFSGELGYSLNPKVSFTDKSSSGGKAVKLFLSVFKARKEIKRIKPDVIFSFLDWISVVMFFSCMGLKHYSSKKSVIGNCLICSERIDPSETKRPAFFRHLINRIYADCAKTVVQTKKAYEFFPLKVRENSLIIPNPVSVLRYAADFSKREKRFVTAGRLTEQKNHKMLIEAFSEVYRIHSDWSLEIYGDGELKESLQKEISLLKLNDAVKLRGNSSFIHKDIADSSVFVLSSDYEGFSNALLEALMMGLCCISTDVAGSGDAIEHKKNGLIVPVKDKEALKNAMLFVIEHKEERERMADEAMKRAVFYRTETVFSEWRKLALDVIEN